ncbi:hypothetical protein JW868_00335 [Candidatus Woesearchaeota archaeon]|nr:hypothetical protein [Candidatus Woesearchaeota archaeon]
MTKKKINNYIYWVPRLLSIIFILFLVLMSLDIFEENYGFWGAILGLFIHNIPAIILLVVLLISWKHEIVGGVAFILSGIIYIALLLITSIRNGFKWYYVSWALQISGIAFFIGIMFLIGWNKKKK